MSRSPTDPHGGIETALEPKTDERADFLQREVDKYSRPFRTNPWRPDVVDYFLSRWEVGLVVVLAIIVSSLLLWWLGL